METRSTSEQAVRLGNRLREEREMSEISIARAAAQLGVPVEMIESMEKGETAPSLPELELLANLYRVPLMKLINTEEGEAQLRVHEDKRPAFILLRTRLIGAMLKQARLDKEISQEDLAKQCEIPQNTLEEYETGTLPIPQPVLVTLCDKLNLEMASLLSPITPKPVLPTEPTSSPNLPPELKEFVDNPSNLPYLNLAKTFSEMDAAKLRALAENLLEITY